MKGPNCLTLFDLFFFVMRAEVRFLRLSKSFLATPQYLNNYDLHGCEIYTSCEPCPMCLAAIYWARIDIIYYANTKKDAADIGFDDDFIYKELSLPENERKIKMQRYNAEDAKKVFLDWIKLENKILY